MHKRVKDFILGIKQIHPEFFQNTDVLDCGSLDVNGNNRPFFIDSHYTGIDIVEGENVDVVTRVCDYTPKKLFDVVISTEMLEHDESFDESLQKMFWFLFFSEWQLSHLNTDIRFYGIKAHETY